MGIEHLRYRTGSLNTGCRCGGDRCYRALQGTSQGDSRVIETCRSERSFCGFRRAIPGTGSYNGVSFGTLAVFIYACLIPGTEGDHFLHHPKQHTRAIGFLAQPPTYQWCALIFKYLDFIGLTHILSVAITRAQSLLIVIGDPDVLGKDDLWRTFLNYACLHEGSTGKAVNWKPEENILPPGYKVIARPGGVVYGESYIDGKSKEIYKYSWDYGA